MRSLLFLIPALLLTGCGGPTTASSDVQVWQFTLGAGPQGPSSATARLTCNAAGICTGGSWALSNAAQDGCALNISFTSAFSGTLVRLSDFARSTDSTCSGPGLPRGDASGSGTADGPFPGATSASGNVTIPFVGVFYKIGGPSPLAWQARRVS
jgi:hypothetical protein